MFALIALLAQMPLAQPPEVQKKPEIQLAQDFKIPPDFDKKMKKAIEDAQKQQQQQPGFQPIIIEHRSYSFGGGIYSFSFPLIVIAGMFAGMWGIFSKAGEPAWASLVPFYNFWILYRIAGKSPADFFLSCLCCLGLIWAVPMLISLARKFGKDTGFAMGMLFLPFVFFPILGFSSARLKSKKKKRRSRDDDDEDEEDEDRPRRRRRDEDDEDEDDRPRRRRRDEDDEVEDDRPRRRRRDEDDEDDEEDRRPSRRRTARDEEDEDDEERPPRRRARDDDDDDEPPPRRKR